MNELNNNQNKKKFNFIGKFKASFSGRKFRSGVYVTLVSTIVMVLVLVANMIVSKLNIQADLSTQNLYTLSDETKGMLKDLKDDITIYYLVQPGNEQDTFQKIIEKYDAASAKIKVVSKDPVLYPKFASKYVDNKVTENSVLVVNKANDRAKYVDYNDMLVQQLNPQTYQNETTGIDVEGKLTSAIQYVTTTDLPKMYVVKGHQEAEIGDAFKSAMDKMNITTEDLSTLTKSSIPEDCNILYLNSPKTDLSDDELKMIKDYMAAGGNAVITTGYDAESLKNFNDLLDYYGIETVNGIISESDQNMHYPNNPFILIPNTENHNITADAAGKNAYVIMQGAAGLKVSDSTRSSLKVEPLLSTSDQSYSKIDPQSSTTEKEDGDIDGPFYVGLAATDTYNNTTSHMVVYSSDKTFDDSVLSQFGNADILNGTISFLAGEAAPLSIPSKSMSEEPVQLSQQQVILWGAFAVIFIPVVILVIGILVSLKRRKR